MKQYLEALKNREEVTEEVIVELEERFKEPEPEPVEVVPVPTLEDIMELKMAQNTVEMLEIITLLNEMQKIEQAQSNVELIELMMMLQGGIM